MPSESTSLISQLLHTYEESLIKNHSEAMKCWDFQDHIACGNGLFNTVTAQIENWRRAVSQGFTAFEQIHDENFRHYLRSWLNTADNALNRLVVLEKEFSRIDGANEFRTNVSIASKLLESWVPPVLSKAQGLHVQDLSEEEAKTLHLAIEQGGAKLKVRPRAIL